MNDYPTQPSAYIPQQPVQQPQDSGFLLGMTGVQLLDMLYNAVVRGDPKFLKLKKWVAKWV